MRAGGVRMRADQRIDGADAKIGDYKGSVLMIVNDTFGQTMLKGINALMPKVNLPFQIVGIIILVATIGVVILSRREIR